MLIVARVVRSRSFAAATFCLMTIISAITALAQSSSFSYQGRLANGGVPASGSYDFQFKLFDDPAAGVQKGSTVSMSNVSVIGGIFTVLLDFGSGVFPGEDRFLEIGVKGAGAGSFTVLAPRQRLAPTPYAFRSLAAGSADALSVACLNCVTSSQIGSVNGSALVGEVPLSSIPPGNGNYIQNRSSVQGGSSFNISHNGTVGGTLTAAAVDAIVMNASNLSFPATLAKKITLYPGTIGDAGFGVFSNELRMASDYSGADITFGYDSRANGFTERMRLKASGNLGIGTSNPGQRLSVNGIVESTLGGFKFPDGSVQTSAAASTATDLSCSTACVSTGELEDGAVTSAKIADGTIVNADIHTSAAIAPTKIAGTAATLGPNSFVGSQSIAGGLTFNAALGKKITLFPGTVGDAGFGVFPNELRIASDYSGADITFGYDDRTNGFTERMRLRASGALRLGNSDGLSGQVITSNGSGTTAEWKSPTNTLFQNTTMTNNTGNISPGSTFTLVPGLSKQISVSGNAKLLVQFSVAAVALSCFACGGSDAFLDVRLNGGMANRLVHDIDNGATAYISGSWLLSVGAGTHTVEIWAESFGPTVLFGDCGTGCYPRSHLIIQVIPE